MIRAQDLEVETVETRKFRRLAHHVVSFGADSVSGRLRKRKPQREWWCANANTDHHANAFADANTTRTDTHAKSYAGWITFSCAHMVSQFVFRSCELQRLSRTIGLRTVREDRQCGNDKFFRHDRTSRADLLLRFNCGKQFECRERNFSAGIQQCAVMEERATHTRFQ